MNHQKLTANDVFNSCIQIEETRISRKLSIPSKVVFQLNPRVLSQLEKIKRNNERLTVEPGVMADLRYYILLNSSLSSYAARQHSLNDLFARGRDSFKKAIPSNSAISLGLLPLTFATSYLTYGSQEKTVVRSIINLKGQISQQIQQDLWQNPQLLPKVIDVHHWLILQILAQLPLKPCKGLALLLNFFGVIVLVVFSICLWFYLPISIWFKILLVVSSCYLFTTYFNQAAKNYLKTRILHSLNQGFWANSTQKRQIAWKALAILS